jgi:catechol 2,3-dioxygenase-like lactoylglutathione lyase family enzyme
LPEDESILIQAGSNNQENTAMRVQLALNVENLDEAVDYYSKLFGVEVNKRKPGYANFAIEEPPLKLVLFEAPEATERLNHLGVETSEQSDVDEAVARFRAAHISESEENESTCCYATQNKVWSIDPGGMRWEWYRVLADADEFGTPKTEPKALSADGSTACCVATDGQLAGSVSGE